MTNIDYLNALGFQYKLGTECGNTLYSTSKHINFTDLVEEAKRIERKFGRDMHYCLFIIQAFTDDSWDFEKSCFSQFKTHVIGFGGKVEGLAGRILKDFEEDKQ